MPPRQKNPALGILWQPLEIGVAPNDPNGCYVYMPYEWIAIFRALFDLLDHDWIWATNPSQKRQWVQEIQFQLMCDPPEKIVEREVARSKTRRLFEWAQVSDMFDFDIEDYIRVTEDGLLQLNIDGCSDCNWVTIWDLGGGNVQRTYDKILDESGKLIDRALAGVTNGANLPKKPNQDADLARCTKATAYAEIVWEHLKAFVDVYDEVTVDISSDEFNFLSVANTAIGLVTQGLSVAPALTPFLGIVELGGILLSVTGQLKNEMQDFVENQSNKQKLTCFYYKQFTTRDGLVGEDVSSALQKIDEFFITASNEFIGIVKGIMRGLPIKETSQFVGMASASNDCGCPDVVSFVNPSAPLKPSTATWSVEADFTTGQHGVVLWDNGIDPQWGTYEAGVGFVNSSFQFEDVPNARQFLRVLINWQQLTGRVLRVDWQFVDVVEGRFLSAIGTGNEDVEKFLTYIDFDGLPRIYAENGEGWHSVSSGATFAQMGLWGLFGYQEVSSSGGGLPSNGQGTLVKMRVHGTGTKPEWFAANGWSDV